MTNNLVATIFLICFPLASTVPPITLVFVTPTHDEAAITVYRSDGSDIVVGSITADPSAGVTFDPATLPTSGAASVNITAMGLTPATEYTFSLEGLTDGSSPLSPATEDSMPTCSKPEPVTDLQVVEAETNTSHIKISWSNPTAPGPITMHAYFDDFETEVTNTADTEFIFTESDTGVDLTADQSGKCKVKITVATGEECENVYSEVEIDCAASDPTSGVSAVKLLPGTLLLCLVYQILAA